MATRGFKWIRLVLLRRRKASNVRLREESERARLGKIGRGEGGERRGEEREEKGGGGGGYLNAVGIRNILHTIRQYEGVRIHPRQRPELKKGFKLY
jgi:hypothetical protein